MDQESLFSPPPPSFQSAGSNLSNNVSPSVFLIIIILAVIFFISGLLHLLVRFFVRPSTRGTRHHDEFGNVTALQGQLQQLFTLHDSGVDQAFIDTLPVFVYKSIIGVSGKKPFDCAICLCEFEGDDNLRMLPKCSHAFHMSCIDTWLLSHSTCPLCRDNLVLDYIPDTCCSPIVVVLESRSGEISREIVDDCIDVHGNEAFEIDHSNSVQNEAKEEENKEKVAIDNKQRQKHTQQDSTQIVGSVEGETRVDIASVAWDKEVAHWEAAGLEKVVTVKLGKFKNVDGSGGEHGDEKRKIDGRRCFSMGSFEYVMDDNSSLQVQIGSQIKKQAYKKSNLPITPGHRPAMSECGDDSRRVFKGVEEVNSVSGGSIGRDSFSVSKNWLRGKNEKTNSTAVVAAAIEPLPRTVSLQFLLQKNVTINDESRAYEMGCDDHETPSGNSFDLQAASNSPSLAKRSLNWFMYRQKNKVVHSSLSVNV